MLSMEYPHDFTAQHSAYTSFTGNDTAEMFPHDFDPQSSAQDHDSSLFSTTQSNVGQKMAACDVKPRMTKEQHDILEAHYQKQQKPNTSTKKGFAEALNVPLEKVNNWFQNRRAKSKQDAKKLQGSAGIFSLSQPSSLSLGASDSDTSPAFASSDYFQMMQQCEAEDELLVAHAGHPYEQSPQHLLVNPVLGNMHLASGDIDMNELNRRTLTQEQFDAFAQQDVMMNSGQLANMLSHDPEVLNKFLAQYGDGNVALANAPMSHQPPLLQVAIDQSTLDFSSIPLMHSDSASSSEWGDSRSSSTASLSHSLEQHSISTPLTQVSSNQWQPGQSVPVDFNQLNQVFQKVAQAKQIPEWSEELTRTDSSTSLITQSLGNVGLQTPETTQQPTFKSPTPASSLAARRQRARPAPLGLASLRSQSYSGATPLGSPGAMQPPSNNTPPQLRRIKSSNVVSGVAQGRIQKNIAAPPQRSPLSWTFSDAINSPQAIRHQMSQSSSSLAPPTPLSPPDSLTPEQQLFNAQQQWQAKHNINTRAAIPETDLEHSAQFTTPTFVSPPHTPMFPQQQQFLPPPMITGNMVMENTPPQSAPASQQTFPQGVFAHAPHHAHQHSQPMIMPQQMPQQMHVFVPQQQVAQPQMMMSIMEQEQLQMAPHYAVTTSAPAMEMPMHFAQNGIPIVDGAGQISLAMPSQLHFVQQKVGPVENKKSSGSIPAGRQTTFSVAGPDMMPLQVTAQVPRLSHQSSTDFFVHEYTPPQDMKRTVTPRKPIDNGPKNYTFTNQTPEHFEKSKKVDSKGSAEGSPASASSI